MCQAILCCALVCATSAWPFVAIVMSLSVNMASSRARRLRSAATKRRIWEATSKHTSNLGDHRVALLLQEIHWHLHYSSVYVSFYHPCVAADVSAFHGVSVPVPEDLPSATGICHEDVVGEFAGHDCLVTDATSVSDEASECCHLAQSSDVSETCAHEPDQCSVCSRTASLEVGTVADEPFERADADESLSNMGSETAPTVQLFDGIIQVVPAPLSNSSTTLPPAAVSKKKKEVEELEPNECRLEDEDEDEEDKHVSTLTEAVNAAIDKSSNDAEDDEEEDSKKKEVWVPKFVQEKRFRNCVKLNAISREVHEPVEVVLLTLTLWRFKTGLKQLSADRIRRMCDEGGFYSHTDKKCYKVAWPSF